MNRINFNYVLKNYPKEHKFTQNELKNILFNKNLTKITSINSEFNYVKNNIVSLDKLEKIFIKKALISFSDLNAVANALGVDERTLYRKFKDYDIKYKELLGINDVKIYL